PVTLDVAVGQRAVSLVRLAAFAVTVAAPIAVDRCGRLVRQRVRSLRRGTRHRQQGLSTHGELPRDPSLFIDQIACRRAGRLIEWEGRSPEPWSRSVTLPDVRTVHRAPLLVPPVPGRPVLPTARSAAQVPRAGGGFARSDASVGRRSTNPRPPRPTEAGRRRQVRS